MSFVLHRPQTLAQAIELQPKTNGSYLAGGTVLMVNYNKGLSIGQEVIDLTQVAELHSVQEQEDTLVLGAGLTFDELEHLPLCRQYAYALWQAACEVGGPQVRNRATLGGNLCAASPSADAATPLLALGAEFELVGAKGTRRIAAEQFFTAPGKTVKLPDEILARVFVPKAGSKSLFYKVGKRNALAVSCINMAVAANANSEGKLSALRIAVGAAAPTVRLCAKTAALLEGKALTQEVLLQATELVQTEIAPIDDRWASADYRRMVCANLLEKLVLELANKEGV